ncbi:MAG: PilZ domain-containing protein [Deltaproteobacteria bacterium]|jgi:hypothetical protein|nr:PilZ domain-containing protein [Deltaproteobacteria bacterium]
MSDRRKFARVPLDSPYFVNFRFHDGAAETALLADLGLGGLQLAFAPTRNIQRENFLGRSVSVDSLPIALPPEEQKLTGTVSWVSPQRCGVRFQTPLCLSETELVIALAAL